MIPPVDAGALRTLLRDLVAINSVNPGLVPGARGEKEAAEFLARFLEQHGIPAELQEAAPGRPNVVARLGPRAPSTPEDKPRAALAILAHMDTVGAGDMPDPFAPLEKNGRLYGRGALDIKSGVAAMCAAALAFARGAGKLGKPLLLAAVVDEECNSLGTSALLERATADSAVVLEPTDLQLVVAHKGYAWFEVATHGRAAHGSMPSWAARLCTPRSSPAGRNSRVIPRSAACNSNAGCCPGKPKQPRARRSKARWRRCAAAIRSLRLLFARWERGPRMKSPPMRPSRARLQRRCGRSWVTSAPREWLPGQTPLCSPPREFPAWFSGRRAAGFTARKNTSSWHRSKAARGCSRALSPRSAVDPGPLRYGLVRMRVVKLVSTGGTTHAAVAGQPASVVRLRQSVTIALLILEGSTAPSSGSA